ncbi:MAG: hypothetical protein J0J06_09145 [Sphingomonas sp.]|uniref:CBU_0592 family membrane protein n=1 Tax=Sphingomonas sp. TaxID=28214 RepID=UPI001AD0FEC8|nr:hypothetical protein [Sphingomonas sp.]MBN8815598.1 hypothetical protein [Sphingomonas sp.]
MTIYDVIGLSGTLVMLVTYGLTVLGKIDPQRAPALAGNFFGAGAVLISLSHDFNLSAAVIESAWALIAAIGLIRLALKR